MHTIKCHIYILVSKHKMLLLFVKIMKYSNDESLYQLRSKGMETLLIADIRISSNLIVNITMDFQIKRCEYVQFQ